jgi:predicted MPP superfamily phosphohydrolase
MLITALAVLRYLLNALICRITAGLRGTRLWRAALIVLVTDAIILAVGSLLLYWVGTTRSGAPVRHTWWLALTSAGLVLIGMLLLWEGAIRLAARPQPVSRRRLGAAALALLLTGVLVLVAAMLPGSNLTSRSAAAPAQVTYWTVQVSGLPPAFNGLRVCLVSDLHLGPNATAADIRGRLRPLKNVKDDLLLFLGDYASRWPRGEDEVAPIVGEQRAPLGVYAVLGNHDRYLGEEHSLRALRGAGVRVLVNENLPITRGGERIYLAGINDPYSGGGDIDATLAGIPPSACVILMSHTPDIIGTAAARHVALVVAGHTHGGQIVVPIIGPPVVRSQYGNKYAHGLFYVGGPRSRGRGASTASGPTAMFVTRGVGEIFPYVRFNCPREIAVLTLRPQ